jgi:hypothetical protein
VRVASTPERQASGDPSTASYRRLRPGAGAIALTTDEYDAPICAAWNAGIWRELPRVPRYADLTPWLISFAIAAFLLEVFHRRTGLLGLRRKKIAAPEAEADAKTERAARKKWRRVRGEGTATAEPDAERRGYRRRTAGRPGVRDAAGAQKGGRTHGPAEIMT